MEITETQRKLYHGFNDIFTKVNTGEWWGIVWRKLFPIGAVLTDAATYQIGLWAIHISIPYWGIIIFLFAKHYIMLVVKYYGGEFTKKIGLWKYNNEFGAKEEHLAPWNSEVQKTLVTICEKLDVKHSFKKL